MSRHVHYISFVLLSAVLFIFLVESTNTFEKIGKQLFLPPTPKVLQIKGIGVIGDSLSDEYQADDARGYEYAPTTLNWIEQLVKNRNINFGNWGVWGDVRRTGFAYNWSRTGANTESAILNGQDTGLASFVKSGEVNVVIIYIGGNDFSPINNSGLYIPIYNGSLSEEQIKNEISAIAGNISSMLMTIKKAGSPKILLISVPDWNLNGAAQVFFQNETGRERVSEAIKKTNDLIVNIAKKEQVAYLDINNFYRDQLQNAPLGSIMIGGESIAVYVPGDEPHHVILSDAVHPGTIANGLFANFLINALNQKFNTNIIPLKENEILKSAGIF